VRPGIAASTGRAGRVYTASVAKRSVSRRVALRALGAGAGTIALLPWLSDDGAQTFAALQRTGARPALQALTPAQYATLDVLVDAIIPADERSPGARDARVVDYIDLLLSEADAEVKQQWFDGLAAVDAEASAQSGAPVAKLQAPQVEALLTAISVNERAPQTAAERFFVMTKRAAIQGYYSSEIGIHKDLRYKGNQFLPEFHGCQTVDGKDCPHCGQKAAV
jgi:Gluconate 2-dehydrogenase subunit 3